MISQILRGEGGGGVNITVDFENWVDYEKKNILHLLYLFYLDSTFSNVIHSFW